MKKLYLILIGFLCIVQKGYSIVLLVCPPDCPPDKPAFGAGDSELGEVTKRIPADKAIDVSAIYFTVFEVILLYTMGHIISKVCKLYVNPILDSIHFILITFAASYLVFCQTYNDLPIEINKNWVSITAFTAIIGADIAVILKAMKD